VAVNWFKTKDIKMFIKINYMRMKLNVAQASRGSPDIRVIYLKLIF